MIAVVSMITASSSRFPIKVRQNLFFRNYHEKQRLVVWILIGTPGIPRKVARSPHFGVRGLSGVEGACHACANGFCNPPGLLLMRNSTDRMELLPSL